VSYLEQIMSKDQYPSIFLRQMEAIVYLDGLSVSSVKTAIAISLCLP